MDKRDLKHRFPIWGRHAREVVGHSLHRFSADQCLRMAASLSYTSLLAAVPLTAIAFAMLAAFPVFEGVRGSFQDMLFANFLPDAAESMREYFDRFVDNTTTLSAVGIVALALTAVLLLGTIESAMNTIFRVTRARRLGPRLLVFWAIITLGPLLLGASFSLSAYFFAATRWLGLDVGTGVLGHLARFLPSLLMIALLTLFYVTIPNRRVWWVGGVVGAVAAGLLIALLRKVFGFYVTSFPTYQNIYGALSAIPIFLIWMYLSWAVVLWGATLAATMGEWRDAGGRTPAQGLTTTSRLTVALGILDAVAAQSRDGGSIDPSAILRSVGSSAHLMERVIDQLRDLGYVERTSRNAWVLARDLDFVTLYDLYRDLGLGLDEDDDGLAEAGWSRRLTEQLAGLRARNAEAMAVPLGELLTADRPSADGGRLKAL